MTDDCQVSRTDKPIDTSDQLRLLRSVHTQLRLTGGAGGVCCGKRDCDQTETWRDGPLHTSAQLAQRSVLCACVPVCPIRKRNQHGVQGRGQESRKCTESSRGETRPSQASQGGGETTLGSRVERGGEFLLHAWTVHD